MANGKLFELIKQTLPSKAQENIFNIIKDTNKIEPIYYSEIFEQMIHYDEILSNFPSRICVIYHDFDVKFIGFILSALKNNFKILIRRTSLTNVQDFFSDFTALQKDIPISMIFSDLPIHDKFQSLKSDLFLLHQDYPLATYPLNFDFIQYSSGSTNTPAGFCLDFNALIKSAYHVIDVNRVTSKSICASYLTLSHIYGFVTGFLLPLLSGAKSYHCSTKIISNDSAFLLKFITDKKITHVCAIMKTLEKALENKSCKWDLSSLFCISVGGEKINYNIYEKVRIALTKFGMNPYGLVNSYGMSELGALTMEDPLKGNAKIEHDGQSFLSVGDGSYKDLTIKVFDENKNELSDDMEGFIGISNPDIADFYFSEKNLQNLKKYDILGREYYFNGDCGFSSKGKIYITGRKLNTVTYNGLKISDALFKEFVKNELSKLGAEVEDCLVFNLPNELNKVICYLNCENIDEKILNALYSKIKKDFHVDIYDFFVEPYRQTGIEKISLPKVIEMYKNKIGNIK